MKKEKSLDQDDRENEDLHVDIITDADAPKSQVIVDDPAGAMVAQGGNDAINRFIEWPIIRSDGSFQPIQFRTSGHLLSNGVDPENLQAACLLNVVMLSARWGYPISTMLVPEDPQAAVQLLDACLKLAPTDAVLECRDLKPEHLYIKGGELLNGKCIISPDPKGFDKVFHEIELILTRGRSTRQEIEKGKYGVGLTEYRSQMQVSVIGVDSGKPGKQFTHSSVLKVPVSAKRAAVAQVGSGITEQYGLLQSPLFKIRKSLQRLKSKPVVIPYEEQLWKALEKSGCDDVVGKMEVLKNVISVCTIINQPPPVQMAELGALIYGTDEIEVRRYLVEAGIDKDSAMAIEEPLVATKVEYHLARLLLDDILMAGQSHFPDRQRKIFETVKTINLGKMSTAMRNKSSEVELLASISQNPSCWADREKIFQAVNGESPEYPLSTVSKDLVDLLEMGVLERAKPPKRRSFGYYITTMALNSAIKLPAASSIEDPVYEGKPVSVVNPLTGQVDKI